MRDLATGQQLLSLPTSAPTADVAVRALRGLFAWHGPPLVLKTDNGSPFCADALLDLLREKEVLPLFSPPQTPRYNGAIGKEKVGKEMVSGPLPVSAARAAPKQRDVVRETPPMGVVGDGFGRVSSEFDPRCAMPSDAWYYYHAGKRLGPVPFMKLKALIDDGQLAASVRVWRKGMSQWTPVSKLAEFGAENVKVISPPLPHEQSTESRTASGGESRPRIEIAQPFADHYHDERLDEIKKDQPRYAGFWIRFAATLFDAFVLYVVCYAVRIVINLALGLPMIVDDKRMNPSDVNQIVAAKMISTIFNVIFGCLYEVLLTCNPRFQGTLGKLAVGVKVTNLEGGTATLGMATGRYFAKMISTLILFLGYIMAAFDHRKQALHDKLAGTYVVYK